MRETESGYCTPAIHRGCPLQFRAPPPPANIARNPANTECRCAEYPARIFAFFQILMIRTTVSVLFVYTVEHNIKRYKNLLKQASHARTHTRRDFSLFRVKRDMRNVQRVGNIRSYCTSILMFSQIVKCVFSSLLAEHHPSGRETSTNISRD